MCYKNILICLIGNKIDLENKREVSYEEGKNFAEENDLLFFETSAKEGNNIQEIFVQSATNILDKINNGEIKLETSNNGIKINSSEDDEESSQKINQRKCC